MAEETQNEVQNTQESQKTLVAFIVGLLIGGLLVWAFSGPSADAPVVAEDDEKHMDGDHDDHDHDDEDEMDEDMEEEETTPQLQVGDGSVEVNDQPASNSIVLESATYPISEGWIGVREYNAGNLGFILGVVKFSESNGLVPSRITLQRSTTAGREYAVVIYTENGDGAFNLASDVQIDEVFDTFTAE